MIFKVVETLIVCSEFSVNKEIGGKKGYCWYQHLKTMEINEKYPVAFPGNLHFGVTYVDYFPANQKGLKPDLILSLLLSNGGKQFD